MKYDWVISLGSACQTAYQVRKHFSQDQAFTFDWLITSFDGLLKCLDNGMRGLIHPSYLVESHIGASIENTVFGILHVHDFELSPNVRNPEWKTTIDQAHDKYDYLAERWEKVISEKSNILFIRHSGHVMANWSDTQKLSIQEANMLCSTIEKAVPGCHFNIAFVNAVLSELAQGETTPCQKLNPPIRKRPPLLLDPRASAFDIDYTDVDEWPDENDWWRGPSSQWRKIFNSMTDQD